MEQLQGECTLGRKIVDFTSDFIISLLMSISFVYALTESAWFKYSLFEIAAILSGFLILWCLVFSSKLSKTLSGLVAFLVFAGAISFLLTNKNLKYLYGIFDWLAMYVSGGADLNSGYMSILTILLCTIVSLFIFIFTFKKLNFPVILAAGMLIFVIQWMLDFFVSNTSFYIFVFTILIYYFRHVFNKKVSAVQSDYLSKGAFTLYILPICLIIFLISFLIPHSKDPIEWKWLDSKINSTYNYLISQSNNQKYEYFNIASTGFGKSPGILGGKVRPDKTPVMSVNSNKRIYLKGSAYATYTGNSWINADTSRSKCFLTGKELYLDSDEALTGINLLMNNAVDTDEIFDKQKVTITYKEIKTKSIFIPIKLQYISPYSKDKTNKQLDSTGSLTSVKILGKGYNYELGCYNIFYDSQEFKTIAARSKKGFYNEYLKFFERMIGDIRKANNTSPDTKIDISIPLGPWDKLVSVSYSEIKRLTENSEQIYDKYLNLPENFPERVRRLAADITSPCQNNYDKVKAIEEYLSSNFPYTLSVPNTPRGRDFVDYFLFDQKKGYCTYYSTAMAVMVRAIGLPSRYVEGFMLPAKPSEGSTYIVTNQNAHAWVEVYFEGLGWIPFEPTAAFRAAFYEATQSNPASVSSSFYEDPNYSEYLKMLQEYNSSGLKIDDDFKVSGPNNEDKYLGLKISGTTAAVVFLLLLLIMLFNYSKNRLSLYRIYKADPRHCILFATARYLKILSFQGFGIMPGETPSEYAKRISEDFFYEKGYLSMPNPSFNSQITDMGKKSGFVAVMDAFSIAKYSLESINDEVKKMVIDYEENLISKTRSNMGKLRYSVYRYIFGVF